MDENLIRYYEGKDVLVTGGAGFIPSHLVDKLVEYGVNVTVIDNLKDSSISNLSQVKNDREFIKGDIRNKNLIDKLVKKNSIIFHLAANANVPFSVENPEYDFGTNAVGTFNVLKSAVDYQAKVIFASSAAVYGEPIYTPIDEEHPPQPISPYGASKLSGEKLGMAYHKTYGLEFVVIRIFNTYGPRQRRYVMYDFLKKLKINPNELEILGNGKQVRDYCYVSDTVDSFLLCGSSDKAVGRVYNVAGGNPISIKELATIMCDLLGYNTNFNFTGKSWKGDINNLTASIDKIRKEINFEPTIKLKEGIKKLIDWFNSHEK